MKRIAPSFAWIMLGCVSASAKAGAYITEQNILIPTSDGATVCAVVVRPDSALRLPAALEFTIYVDLKKNLERLEYAAGDRLDCETAVERRPGRHDGRQLRRLHAVGRHQAVKRASEDHSPGGAKQPGQRSAHAEQCLPACQLRLDLLRDQ